MAVVSTQRKLAPHSLNDILARSGRVVLQPVDPNGAVSGPPVQISDEAEMRGWVCIRCQVLFHQWQAALAHIRDMNKTTIPVQDMEVAQVVNVRRRRRARVFTDDQITDIIRFTRDVMGIQITEAQARAAAIALRTPIKTNSVDISRRAQNRSLASRIAAEYREIKQ